MTQEELDSLMSGEMDLDSLGDDAGDSAESSLDEDAQDEGEVDNGNDNDSCSLDSNWPPPPPTEDHKVVNQLDDVTRESEVKATEVFDKLELVAEESSNIEGFCGEIKEILESQKDVFEKLSSKFPDVAIFKDSLEKIDVAINKSDDIVNATMTSGDEIMMIMDIMQYQDIHRQKIERVINVMRALSKYMNSLFEGKVDDSKRVSSATHIDGDVDTEDVVDNEDIEALIASLGGK